MSAHDLWTTTGPRASKTGPAARALIAIALGCGLAGCGDASGESGTPAEGGSLVWARRFGRTSSADAIALAVDGDGNVIVAGRFFGTADFGTGPITSPAGNWQGFVAKYDSAGAALWVRSLGGIYEEQVSHVAVDDARNVYIAGTFRGAMELSPGVVIESAGWAVEDVFVAKLAPDGSHRYAKRIGSSGYVSLAGMGVGPDGQLAIAGYGGGEVEFGDGSVTVADTSFVAQLRADGTVDYAKPWGAPYSYSQIQALTVDREGAVILVTSDYGGSAQAEIAKLDSAGGSLWSRPFASSLVSGWSDSVATSAITLGSDGTIYVTGTATGDVKFGDQLPAAGDGLDAFVAAIDEAGVPRWARRFSSKSAGLDMYDYPSYAEVSSRSIAARGDRIAVTGAFSGQVDFGGGVRTSIADPDDPSYAYYQDGDVFTLLLDGEGERVWDVTFGNADQQAGTSIGIDPFGDVFVAGFARGDLSFGEGLGSSLYYDGFTIKLAP